MAIILTQILGKRPYGNILNWAVGPEYGEVMGCDCGQYSGLQAVFLTSGEYIFQLQ